LDQLFASNAKVEAKAGLYRKPLLANRDKENSDEE
jgi:hypothetical protein